MCVFSDDLTAKRFLHVVHSNATERRKKKTNENRCGETGKNLKLTFLAGMFDHVPSQIFFSKERLRTMIAFDRFGTLVHELYVRREADTSIERTIAMRTRECVLAGMMKYVSTQLDRLYKRFTAKLTGVRFLAGVRSKVSI